MCGAVLGGLTLEKPTYQPIGRVTSFMSGVKLNLREMKLGTLLHYFYSIVRLTKMPIVIQAYRYSY